MANELNKNLLEKVIRDAERIELSSRDHDVAMLALFIKTMALQVIKLTPNETVNGK